MLNKILNSRDFLTFSLVLVLLLVLGFIFDALGFTFPSLSPPSGNSRVLVVEDGAPANSVKIASTGYVGIGDTNPLTRLWVFGVISGPSSQNFRLRATGATAGNGANGSIYFLDSAGVSRVRLDTRTLAGGNSYATVYTGSTNTSAQDVAEYYHISDQTLQKGELVSLDSSGLLQRAKNTDKALLGVISTNPGVVLGDNDYEPDKQNQRLVALAGRVPVKVNNRNGSIQPGDLITISDIPGQGQKLVQSGWYLGKALQSFSQDQGIIQVFISSGYKEEGLLEKLGVFIEEKKLKLADLAAGLVSAKHASFDNLEMIDEVTGEVYCLSLETGSFKVAKGICH